MKKITSIVLAFLLIICLTACGQNTSGKGSNTQTWQEQYDLGVKYLSEGNYEEAIIAFTAAIEIDPKKPDTYKGRADAYLAVAQAETDTAVQSEYYDKAIADLNTAVGMDSSDEEAWDKLITALSDSQREDELEDIYKEAYVATGNDKYNPDKMPGWHQDENGWWFVFDDGTYPADQWFKDDKNDDYYAGPDGYILTDTITPDGYRVDANGKWNNDASTPDTAEGLINGYNSATMIVGDNTLEKPEFSLNESTGNYEAVLPDETTLYFKELASIMSNRDIDKMMSFFSNNDFWIRVDAYAEGNDCHVEYGNTVNGIGLQMQASDWPGGQGKRYVEVYFGSWEDGLTQGNGYGAKIELDNYKNDYTLSGIQTVSSNYVKGYADGAFEAMEMWKTGAYLVPDGQGKTITGIIKDGKLNGEITERFWDDTSYYYSSTYANGEMQSFNANGDNTIKHDQNGETYLACNPYGEFAKLFFFESEQSNTTSKPVQNSNEYIINGSDMRYLTKEEIQSLSKEDLRIARNEIYARHGRLFSSADLQQYFNNKMWYKGYIPAEQFNESFLNEYEKANLITIKEVENSK